MECPNLLNIKGCDRGIDARLPPEVFLRPADMDDCQLIWEWANDPEVRRQSFSTEYIPWEKHVVWYRNIMSSPDCDLFIVCNSGNEPIGQVRFECSKESAVISGSVDKRHRNLRFASAVIKGACCRVFNEREVKIINAYVKPGNTMTVKLLERAGFVLQDSDAHRSGNLNRLHFTLITTSVYSGTIVR
jgi:UDP-2,4-diacetamido-2,4,6-trideoxy-beta-L-altropyranose hydrolase